MCARFDFIYVYFNSVRSVVVKLAYAPAVLRRRRKVEPCVKPQSSDHIGSVHTLKQLSRQGSDAIRPRAPLWRRFLILRFGLGAAKRCTHANAAWHARTHGTHARTARTHARHARTHEGLHASLERGSDMARPRAATARSVESMSYKRTPDAAHAHSLCILSHLLRPGRTPTKY